MNKNEDLLRMFQEFLNNTRTPDDSYVVNGSASTCSNHLAYQFGTRFIPVFYCVNFLLSYLGNGLVFFIIYKYDKLNTVTNIFLMNWVLSNLLFAGSLPFWAVYHQSEWIFGKALCKMVSSAYFIGFYSSILFLTLMTIDRYLAVVHAIAAASSRKRAYAIIASVAVWCISILASVKELVLQNVWKSPLNGLVCEETGYSESVNTWRLVTYYQQFLLFFLLPLFIVIYCYLNITMRILSTRMKERCRVIKHIFAITVTFFICWTPYNIVILLQAIQISSRREEDDSCSASEHLTYALYVTRNIAYLYCCISPMFYTFMGKKFQSHFKSLMVKNIPCLKRHVTLTSSRDTSPSAS